MEMKIRPKEWHCEKPARITWETVQDQFLYRAREEEEDESGSGESNEQIILLLQLIHNNVLGLFLFSIAFHNSFIPI